MYLFVHHSDLRIPDNETLNWFIKNKKEFTPIFIFTPEQIIDNPYKSNRSILFMIESLADLEKEYQICGIKLYYYLGSTVDVLEELVKTNKILGIGNNMDYSPYARDREQLVEDLCNRYNIECIMEEDRFLNSVVQVLKKDHSPYLKFTPYYNVAREYKVDKPEYLIPTSKSKKILNKTKYDTTLESIREKIPPVSKDLIGGRKNAIEILKGIKRFENYNDERNIPSISTTRLSAHLKFGTVSCREVYHKVLDVLGQESELIKQLYWREFYNVLLYHFGSATTKEEFSNIEWENNKEYFKRWCEGTTGCPIVDAGMREMNSTGFMHNRLRMIVASYLIFYLKIDWRWGMKYFSQSLIDIDWANNVGNWQWVAGVEKWSNDYYKVFSMESQTKRFDPDCIYIKKWVPELMDVDPKDIILGNVDYVEPIITDYKKTRNEGIMMYKEAIKKYKEGLFKL